MLASDPAANAMLFKVAMPDQNLKEAEIGPYAKYFHWRTRISRLSPPPRRARVNVCDGHSWPSVSRYRRLLLRAAPAVEDTVAAADDPAVVERAAKQGKRLL
jgi:hypothetical protein